MSLPGSMSHRLEKQVFWAIPVALFFSSVALMFLQSHVNLHNPRVQYGVRHLPEALLLAAFFAAIAGLLFTVFSRSATVEEKPVSYYLLALVVAFCLCWLPVLLTGRFVQDDWMLLSGASIRKIIYLHPGYAWFSLDTVDGNFRPLGTTLYFAYMLKFFGMKAFAFLSGNFVVNLAGSIVAFFLVRELGYSKVAGAAASLLYMTRGLNYTENAWACALGDGIVILLGGLTVLLILRANKSRAAGAFLYQGLAWILFCVALFAKQSSFSIPLIAALLVLIHPGETELAPLRRRAGQAFAALVAYSIPVAMIFFHAKALLRQRVPYPISFSMESFTQWLSYIPWYFVGVIFPGKYRLLAELTKLIGLAILVGAAIFVARVPRTLGKRPRDIAFLLLAALAAIAPYALLPTRTAPYYGAMSSFWISIAIAIAVTQFGGVADKSHAARNAYFALYLIVIVGFLDIRLKQTGLIPSGGYIWGTFGMDEQKATYDQLAGLLAKSPNTDTVVLVNFPVDGKYATSMAWVSDPALRQVLVYDSKTRTYLVNNLGGLRPKDGLEELNDAQSYQWSVPILSPESAKIDLPDKTVWVEFDGKTVRSITPVR
jgi:hypothetical protein